MISFLTWKLDPKSWPTITTALYANHIKLAYDEQNMSGESARWLVIWTKTDGLTEAEPFETPTEAYDYAMHILRSVDDEHEGRNREMPQEPSVDL